MTATRPERERLPNRRIGETFELEVAGLRYTATIGRFPDGRIGEIFLNNHKSNSAATRMRATAPSCAASRFNMALILKPFAGPYAVIARGARRGRSARRSTASRTGRAHERRPSSPEGRPHRA